jgi:hypothetical protein
MLDQPLVMGNSNKEYNSNGIFNILSIPVSDDEPKEELGKEFIMPQVIMEEPVEIKVTQPIPKVEKVSSNLVPIKRQAESDLEPAQELKTMKETPVMVKKNIVEETEVEVEEDGLEMVMPEIEMDGPDSDSE